MDRNRHAELLLVLLVCLFTLAFLPSSVGGEAESTAWTPARVDFSDWGLIRVVGLDADTGATVSPAVDAYAAELEESFYYTGAPARTGQAGSSTTQSIQSASQVGGEWITIFSDDFEGAFPGEWHVFDGDGDTNGEYFWGKRDCRPYAGSYSAWAVGGGADGSALPCGSHYPDNADSVMIFGPFSLEDATQAELRFMYWLNTEPESDHLWWGASIGGTFYGTRTSGTRDWALRTFDLTDVYTLGDLTGEDQVWVAFGFTSNESTTLPEGAYVDDVVLRKYVEGEPMPPPVASFSGDPTTGAPPLEVQFSDESSGNPTGWAWYFGDEAYDELWAPMTGAPWTPRGRHTSVALPDGSIVLMGGRNGYYYHRTDVWRSPDQGASWTQMTAAAEWTARSGHTSVVLPDGSIILMGGYYWDGSGNYLNDVWHSTDMGATWTQMTAAAEWAARSGHTSVVLPDGSIILMGGYYWDGSGNYLNDVWRSTDMGATWTQMTADAEWNARHGHSSVVLPDGSIIMMGGYYLDESIPYRNDIWRSTDQGATWTQMTADAEWNARHGHSSVVLPDSSIVLIGGLGDTTDDVWRSIDQGETWTQMTAAVEWTGRGYHTSVALPDGSIVLMGGERSQIPLNDVWHSTDQGATWTQMTPAAGWSERALHTSVALRDGSIVLMGGNEGWDDFNDVWRSTDQGVTWTQMTPAAGWSERALHTSVALRDGSIVLMGGNEGWDGVNDVWRSTDQGATWTQMTPAAGWSERALHTSVALRDGSIVLMGGNEGWDDFNDVWRSTDQGATWTQMTADAEWNARHGHSSVALPDGSIVLMGGYDGSYLNDVWRSTDQGATWTQMTAAAEWTARKSHTSVALPDGSIVLIGGFSDTVWCSTDRGATWTEMDEQSWIRRGLHTSVVLPDGSIVLMGGLFNLPQPYGTLYYELNDVWRLETAGSMEQHPTHIYIELGTYSVALQVYNAGGFTRVREDAYINVTDVDEEAPEITSANSTTFAIGAANSFIVTATGTPMPAITKTGALPERVTFTDHGDGTATLAGVPAEGTAGVYNLTIAASNGVPPDATQAFTLTVIKQETPEVRSVYLPLVVRQTP